jgi:hypothetical protein
MAAEIVKERLIKELEKLPQERLQEVLDFVEYILTKEGKRSALKSPDELDPRKDPILKLIGIADVEPFSHKIDEELYGVEQ